MGKLKRIINIFLSPAEVFEELKNESDWLLPLSIIIVVSLLSTLLLLPSVIIPNQAEMIAKNPNLTLEQKNASMAYLKGPFLYVTTIFSTTIMPIIVFAILAGVVMLIRGIFGGEKVKFKKVFSAVIYTGLIGSLGTLFNSIVMYTQKTINVGLNLALILPQTTGFLQRLYKGITVFGLWQVILMGILLTVFYKYSKRKAFTIIFTLWIIWKIGVSLVSIPGMG